MKKIKSIAIISFESKKTDIIEWSYFNKELLKPHKILASGFAANILEGTLNKDISKLEASNAGGNRQMCNLITDGKIDALIIFGESNEILESKDLKGVLDAAIQHNILVAANRTSADFIIHSSLIESNYTIHLQEKKLTDDKKLLNTSAAYTLAKAS